MPKDTKSLGYNKAPACESRGFGHKKEGENFDTPSRLCAIATRVNSVFTFSNPLNLNRFHAELCFICAKTASGSIHRLPR